MDKKMYFEPEMEELNLKLEGFLCGSPIFDDDSNGEVPMDNTPSTDPSDF